ncbi:YncE family protein [Xylanibacter muris]|uniref:WD40 repeat protein n=1 Tax=Xylanibacter muris TaxID=2736290 RepID=A0ABX2AQ62_9BACT|nr:hypothetical protein [Xylanibacter muris]NPD93114.1 hypothetical protein [Xylanibacter muris]
MRVKNIFIIIVLLLIGIAASAQKKRIQTKKAKDKIATVDNAAEQKIKLMTEATQKIIVVDSIVVNRNDFLKEYLLNPEAGKIGRYNDLFNSKKHPDAFAYINELGDKCYYSMIVDTAGTMKLYTSDYFDGNWTKPEKLKGLDEDLDITSINYPFMMADGTTLYFAAKGNESIGGFDIFVTRFDSETGKFLKPENIGMPFNSTANDYMYAIDEYANIGWFATDRGQDENKVCIYTFIPSETRQTYSIEEYSSEQIERFSKLTSISETWGKGGERKQALARIKEIPNRLKKMNAAKVGFTFIINDKITYKDLADFKTEEGMRMFIELQRKQEQHKKLSDALSKARKYYMKAGNSERTALKADILKSEQLCELIESEILKTEKNIRNAENKALGKK